MRAKTTWAYLAAALVAAGLHWLLPGSIWPAVAWDLLGVCAVAACVIGLRRNRPDDRRPWVLLAAGIALLLGGDLVWDVSVQVFGHAEDFIPASDVMYLAAYPFLALGLLRLVMHRRGRGSLIDVGVVAIALAAPLFTYVIQPVVGSAPQALADRVITISYPTMDVVLMVVVAYALLTMSRWNTSVVLLVAGISVTMVADVLYARLSISGGEETARWLDAFWPASYALVAAALLHPSMRDVHSSSMSRKADNRGRLGILALALCTVPISIVVQAIAHDDIDPPFLAVTSSVIVSLVLWRLALLGREISSANAKIAANEQRFRALIQNTTDAVSITAANGEVLYSSPAVDELLGRPLSELLGKDLSDLVHDDDRPSIERRRHDIATTPGRTIVLEARIRHADGTWRWIETAATNHLDEPAIRGIVANFRDVTAHRRSEALDDSATHSLELIARRAPLRAILEGLLHSIEEQLEGRRCAIRLRSSETGAALETIMTPADESTLSLPARWSVPIVVSESERRLGQLTVHSQDERSPLPDDVGLVERMAALAAVAVDRAAAEDRLHHQAFHDPLTGLPNRTLLIDRLGQALLRLQRNQGTVAVMFLDLDRFKVINDSLGHDAGDELLLEIGRRISDSLQAADTVARFGGDEFVMVCERLEGVHEARALAERVTRALNEPITLPRGGLVVASASIGIALAGGPNDRPEALLRDADAAMYRAKERGGGFVEVFDAALRSHVVVRLETERSLRRAIEKDELRVRYQPVYDLKTDAVVGAEGLVRWQHPTRGLLGPDDFIEVAEETGLIVSIGEWMLQRAGELLTRLASDVASEHFIVSVNLSGRQLLQRDLVKVIQRELEHCGAVPRHLCLEITESVLLDDVDASAAALRSLKEVGIRLAVDDFGTGYSSLGYLKQFPFDLLKIDRAFVAGLGTSDADDTIVAATAQMAHALGMAVVAEGVESEMQRERARELGCDFAQGYLFSAPQAMEEVFGSEPAPRLHALR